MNKSSSTSWHLVISFVSSTKVCMKHRPRHRGTGWHDNLFFFLTWKKCIETRAMGSWDVAIGTKWRACRFGMIWSCWTSNNFYLEFLIPFSGMHLITRVFMCVHDVHCIIWYVMVVLHQPGCPQLRRDVDGWATGRSGTGRKSLRLPPNWSARCSRRPLRGCPGGRLMASGPSGSWWLIGNCWWRSSIVHDHPNY